MTTVVSAANEAVSFHLLLQSRQIVREGVGGKNGAKVFAVVPDSNERILVGVSQGLLDHPNLATGGVLHDIVNQTRELRKMQEKSNSYL